MCEQEGGGGGEGGEQISEQSRSARVWGVTTSSLRLKNAWRGMCVAKRDSSIRDGSESLGGKHKRSGGCVYVCLLESKSCRRSRQEGWKT